MVNRHWEIEMSERLILLSGTGTTENTEEGIGHWN